MKKQRIRMLAVLGIFLLIGLVAVYGRGPSFGFGAHWDRETWPVQFQNNGEQIYFTGTSSSGLRIGASGGGMHMRMHDRACVTCHGAERQGKRLMPWFWKVAPPLTPAALFGEHGETSKDDGHGDHDKYDDVTLRQAIAKGIDPSGAFLDREMPRWSMAERDMMDLITFLKSPVRSAQ